MAINPEVTLWRAVLWHGLNDADAGQWIRTRDFRCVCDLAGVDPESAARAWHLGNTVKRNRMLAA